jgi:hypothetical protein
MRILVIQIPAQTAEDVLTRLKQHIKLTPTLLTNPIDIAFHIPLRVPSAENRDLGLKKLRQSLLPLMRASRVTQTRMEEHKAIKVRIEGTKVLCLVHGMEVVDVSGDLHLATESVLDDSAEGVLGSALGQRELAVPVCHALGSNEDEMQESTRVHVLQLQPHVTGQGGFGAGTQDEDSYWGCL